MGTAAAPEDLRRFVHEHHLHYEVEPETVDQGGARAVVGWDVTLFATHGEAPLPVPDCRRCNALRGELREVAERLVRAGAEDRTQLVEELAPTLHRSTEVPGADEVSVTVRVRCEDAGHRGPGAGPGARTDTDPCLQTFEDRLQAAGAPRR